MTESLTARVILAPLLLTVIGGCGSVVDEASEPDASAAVYSALLRETVLAEGWSGPTRTHEDRRPIERLVVRKEAETSEVRPEDGEWLRPRFRLDPSTASSFEARAGEGEIAGPLEGVGEYVMVDRAQVRRAFALGWRSFYETFAGSPGLVTFSHVGFSNDGREALVYMSHMRGGHWGYGGYFRLVLRGGEWIMTDRYVFWEA